MDPRGVVEQFWAAMGTNDFRYAGSLLADDFVLDWPQSGERVRGRANFASINEAYPSQGPWRFAVRWLVADGPFVATEVAVTDGATRAVALTFSEVRDGLIVRQTEYWPDPFPAAPWRAQWVERIG
jgi:ketosteroid isomerase-like protein